MFKKATALLFAGASLLSWIGCGSTASRFVYAAVPASSQVAAFREDPNSGVLTALTGSPFTAGSGAQSLALHPAKKFLYVANSTENDVSLFTIGSKGDLAEVMPRAAAGTTPMILAIDSGGAFLYAANATSRDISVFAISSSDGTLSPVAGSPFPVGVSPLSMKLSPSGNFLYVGGPGSPGLVEVFSISSGVLTAVGTSQTGTNPYGLTLDPTGGFLYTGNSGDNSISEFSIDSAGTLTELAGSPVGQSFSNPLSLLVDSSGKYLYVANEGSSNIAAYAIDSGGALTILTGSPFSATRPTFLAADPTGKYLVAGSLSGSLQVYALDAGTGKLSSVGTYSTGSAATSVVVMP